MASAARNGIDGLRAYLPSSIKGGARSAEDVTVHTTMLISSAGAPNRAIAGMTRKAAQDSAVAATTQMPRRPSTRVTLSAAMPVKKSQTVKIAWSSISTRMTAPGAIPAAAARLGR